VIATTIVPVVLPVVIVKVPVLDPAATVIVAGTTAMALLLLRLTA
jgi:hypothetical protein